MGSRAGRFSSRSIRPIARTAVRRVAMSGLRSPVSSGASADESLARASSASSMRWRDRRSWRVPPMGTRLGRARPMPAHTRGARQVQCGASSFRDDRVDYSRNDTLETMRIPRFARNDKSGRRSSPFRRPARVPRFPVPVPATNFFPHARSVRIESQVGSSQAVRPRHRLALHRVQHARLARPGRRRGGDEPESSDRAARARGALPVLGARSRCGAVDPGLHARSSPRRRRGVLPIAAAAAVRRAVDRGCAGQPARPIRRVQRWARHRRRLQPA